jgi:hypothetical protein
MEKIQQLDVDHMYGVWSTISLHKTRGRGKITITKNQEIHVDRSEMTESWYYFLRLATIKLPQ